MGAVGGRSPPTDTSLAAPPAQLWPPSILPPNPVRVRPGDRQAASRRLVTPADPAPRPPPPCWGRPWVRCAQQALTQPRPVRPQSPHFIGRRQSLIEDARKEREKAEAAAASEPAEPLGAGACVQRDGRALLSLLFTLRGPKATPLSRALKVFEVRGGGGGPVGTRGQGRGYGEPWGTPQPPSQLKLLGSQ